MTHDDVVLVLTWEYPGVSWSYDGDGASLDPVDGVQLGLVWNDESAAPTLDQLAALLADAQAKAASAPATAADHAAASAALITAKLASVPIPKDELPTILETLLDEASSAIPFFETYALDPSMTSPQWAAFQALDQATKDRLLYDGIRSLAALMRYLTGDLPTS